MRKGPKKTVALGLSEESYHKIKELADETCRTVPNYIRRIVSNYLHRLEKTDPKQNDWWVVK